MEETLIVIAYAQTGLGHLRVANALFGTAPHYLKPVLFRSPEQTSTILHRLTSIHPLLRKVLERSQNGWAEDLVSKMYLQVTKFGQGHIYREMKTLLNSRIMPVRHMVIVCTHFGLAHQLARMKSQFEEREQAKLTIVVCMTDDSPQKLWYVVGADCLVVPSSKTKKTLESYAKHNRLPKLQIEVSPYPLSREFSEEMSLSQLKKRVSQLTLESEAPIHVSIPVSGAAVGLSFTQSLVRKLTKAQPRFRFTIISREAPYTHTFLRNMNRKPGVTIASAVDEREVVALYETAVQKTLFGFEITKPSEQAFKALLCPTHQGGTILLLTEPVGRQEYDNLDFLARHGLMPTPEEHQKLFSLNREELTPALWRAIRLPTNPTQASSFIQWCFKSHIFSEMLACRSTPSEWDQHADEMGWNGAEKFWELVEFLTKKDS